MYFFESTTKMSIFALNQLQYLKFLIRVFNFFGLTAFTIENHKKETKPYFKISILALMYNVLMILIVGYANYFHIHRLYVTKYKKLSKLSMFDMIDLFEVLFGTFVVLLILFHHSFNQEALINFASKIYQIKLKISEMRIGNKERLTNFSLLLFLMFHMAVSIIIVISGIMYFDELEYFLSSASRNLVITWLTVQYAIVVRILENLLKCINVALENLASSSKSKIFVNANKLSSLTSIRNLHSSLLDVCPEVIRFYEVTILGAIAYIFACVILFTYFLIYPVIEKKMDFLLIEYVHFLLWLVSFTTAFIPLSRFVTKIMDEVRSILNL